MKVDTIKLIIAAAATVFACGCISLTFFMQKAGAWLQSP